MMLGDEQDGIKKLSREVRDLNFKMSAIAIGFVLGVFTIAVSVIVLCILPLTELEKVMVILTIGLVVMTLLWLHCICKHD